MLRVTQPFGRHMDWLADSRIHFDEIVTTRILVLLPFIALGFGPGAIAPTWSWLEA